jgi:hypothetical protein
MGQWEMEPNHQRRCGDDGCEEEEEVEADYYWRCVKVCKPNKHSTTTEKQECSTSTRKPYGTTTEERRTTTHDRPRTSTPDHDDGEYGHCPYGQQADGHGCCPRKIDHQFYYPDGHSCYPIKTAAGVQYADGEGVLPDEHGQYRKAGEWVPKERWCKSECD